MSFVWPALLWLLALVPVLVGVYLRLQARRQQLAERAASLGLGPGTAGRGLRARRHLPPALFLAALTALLVALARPQAVVSLPRLEGTVILAFDVSRSMAAEDMAPSRMEASKAAAREFVQRQPPTVQMGVVAFSNGGLAAQVPTGDEAAVLAAIQRLTPQRGTSLAQGIVSALNAIAANAGATEARGGAPDAAETLSIPAGDSAVIVLLSDGENTDGSDPLEAAIAAAELGVRIFTIGLGSPAGATIELDGFSVHTQPNEAVLRQIAEITGGAYFSAQDQAALSAIYDEVVTELVVRPEEMEITSLLAGAGMLLLLLGGGLSLVWFGRVP
jgi:Ca-activated chloride channel family protein